MSDNTSAAKYLFIAFLFSMVILASDFLQAYKFSHLPESEKIAQLKEQKEAQQRSELLQKQMENQDLSLATKKWSEVNNQDKWRWLELKLAYFMPYVFFICLLLYGLRFALKD